MVGLISTGNAFKGNFQNMPLNSPSGCEPMYCVYDKDGNVLRDEVGSWEQGSLKAEIAIDATDPLPPELNEGEYAVRCSIDIRLGISPDAKKFRDRHGLAEKKSNSPKTHVNSTLSEEQKRIVMIASCIHGWHDLPGEDANGNPCLFKYDEQAAIDLVKSYPVMIDMVTNFLGDLKKFEAPFQKAAHKPKSG